MEGLAPPLRCLIEIHAAIQNGEPARFGAMRFLDKTDAGEFGQDLRRFIFAWDQGHDYRRVMSSIRSPYRRALLEVLANGLAGQPILTQLNELKTEIETAADLEIRQHMEILPIRMLVPLLMFQFPAFLLLLFGPLLKRLLEEINR